MAFLGLAALSLWAANLLNSAHNQHFAVLTFLGLVGGLIGAGVCSVRGLKSFDWLPRD
jgi:hypothetical protein